jgi:predicted NBD/HSP70 family sugar kinase
MVDAMSESADLLLVRPAIAPPLDPHFCPIALGQRAYARAVAASQRGVPLGLALERQDGLTSVFRTYVAAPGGSLDDATRRHVERLVKFLLWQIGGWKLVVGGPREIGDFLAATYARQGARAFDVQILERVYERPFVVETTDLAHLPPAREASVALGGHLDGCRIGFDLGASDYKLAAVRNGEPVFTTEIPWDPKAQSDPDWHYRKINEGLKLAAQHLPRVDTIGGSSAGIYIDNRVMVASLFRAVPADQFADRVKPLFLNLQKEWGVPLEVANDGDVTALAGAMSLKVNGVLGVALGSSQAVGFLDSGGCITGWLNELAFAPVDFNPQAPADEWSGDLGCGVQYFSQQAVGRLLAPAGVEVDPKLGLPEKLKHVQVLMAQGDPRARKIYETLGVYLGYAAAQYATMYDYGHMLVLGRVTSGEGGEVIVSKAREVLRAEFPDRAETLSLHLPDEKSKRVGQAVAAASLPKLR